MKINQFLTFILLYLPLSIFAQNAIEGTWILPNLNDYNDYNSYLYMTDNEEVMDKTKIIIQNNEIHYEGIKFYQDYWKFGNNNPALFEETTSIEEPAEEEYTETEEEVTEEEYTETEDIFIIDETIVQDSQQITITFHQKETTTLGFLSLQFIDEKRAYIKSYYGFSELPITEEMKINWIKEDLSIVYIEKEFKELFKLNTFPINDKEVYFEFWENYLEEIKKEKNQEKLKNLALDFQINLLKGKHFARELQQNVLEKLNYNIFTSLDSLAKATYKFAYPEKLRAMIRGNISEEEIENIKDKLNQKWFANIIIPMLAGWEFGYEDRNVEEIPEINLAFEIDYPNFGVNWDTKGMPSPPPSQYQSFSIEIKSMTVGTDQSNGTMVLLIPANFLDSPRNEDAFVVVQFFYLSDSTISLKPLRNDFKTLEEAKSQFEDIPKEKNNFMLGISDNSPTISLINQAKKEKYDKLPILEVNKEVLDSLAKLIETKDNKMAYWAMPLPNSANFYKGFENQILWENTLADLGYNPSESYKAILKFQIEQAKYWKLEQLKDDIKKEKERLIQIKKSLNKPDSLKLKNIEEEYYEEYDLEDSKRDIKDLENQLKILELKIELDSLDNLGQGYSKEAENIRNIIEFEEKYKQFTANRNEDNFFIEELEYTYEEAKEYLDTQKELDKRLSEKQKKKQRKAKEKAKKEEQNKEELTEEFVEEEYDYSTKESILREIQYYLEDVTYYLHHIKNTKLELEQFINKYQEFFPEKVKLLEEKLENTKKMPQKIQAVMDKLVMLEKEIKNIEEWEDPDNED